MRVANLNNRATLILDDTSAVDLEVASQGEFSSEPMSVFARWDELRRFSTTILTGSRYATADLLAPSPAPRQVFGIGLNYRAHAAETGAAIPETPLTFTKFSSSINSPNGEIPISVPTVDYEIELVVVIGAGGRDVDESTAWGSIAGVCVGQDVSDRVLQRATQPPQFNLGKSRRGYAPFGPWIVDAATLPARDAMALRCTLNGDVVQESNSDDLIFNVPQLIVYLSAIVELYPGDVIFTGTPSGVGAARTPPRFLQPGDVLTSTIAGIGSITNRCV